MRACWLSPASYRLGDLVPWPVLAQCMPCHAHVMPCHAHNTHTYTHESARARAHKGTGCGLGFACAHAHPRLDRSALQCSVRRRPRKRLQGALRHLLFDQGRLHQPQVPVSQEELPEDVRRLRGRCVRVPFALPCPCIQLCPCTGKTRSAGGWGWGWGWGCACCCIHPLDEHTAAPRPVWPRAAYSQTGGGARKDPPPYEFT
jgi:hypothetical protein